MSYWYRRGQILKANPYRDAEGKFTSQENASSGSDPSPSVGLRPPQVTRKQIEEFIREKFQESVRDNPGVYSQSDIDSVMSDPGAFWDNYRDDLFSELGYDFYWDGSDVIGPDQMTELSFSDLSPERQEMTIRELSKGLDYPDDLNLFVRFDTQTFNFSGMSGTYAGRYQADDGSGVPNVTVFANVFDLTADIQGVLKHELMHHKFKMASAPVMADINSSPALIDLLEETDGVTPYSRDWWTAVGNGTANSSQAINETFAEIATLSDDDRKDIDQAWLGLYEEINSIFDSLPKKRKS